MARVAYSDDHIKNLREFFADPVRNSKLRNILDDFPDPSNVRLINNTSIGNLHIRVMKKFLQDIYLSYRIELTKWAEITKQTAVVDPEYLSMHLVSLYTGVPGIGTAARGFDLIDGSEVKSSSRVEQLGKCNKCGAPVMAFEDKCGNCGSEDVQRKFDSHWIFSLRTNAEVQNLLSRPTLYLVLLDYEDISKRDIIRIRIWKLDPKDRFVQVFFRDYYFEKFFVQRVEKGETPAPCNLHPDKPLTKFLKPKLLFIGKMDFSKSDVSIELINSEGIAEVISTVEARRLKSEGRGFFKKAAQLGLRREFEERLEQIKEKPVRSLLSF